MNILIFAAREFNPIMGGIERVSSLLARFLTDNGHQVYFLAAIKTSDQYYVPEVVQFMLPDGDFKGTRKNKEYVLFLLEKLNIDIIINQTDVGFLFTRSYLPERVKIISVIHNSYKAMNDARPNLYRKLRYRLAITFYLTRVGKVSDYIVLFSDRFITEFNFYCKCLVNNRIRIIPNFNTYQSVNLPLEKEKCVLCVGRLFNENKRVDRLLRIWQLIEDRAPLWKLCIVGDGPDEDMLKELSRSLKLNRVSFEGAIEPVRLYEKASIYCMVSSYESFGMVLTEAMQHGVVPIAFNSYVTASEIIDTGMDGFLITPFDLEEYARTLLMLMNDEQLRDTMAQKAITSVQKYSLANIGNKWLNLLESCNS